MTPEKQNIEYKSAWQDDYLKWVCGFANAQGGKIYIGKDDNENVVGINDYKRQMEEIPNKIKNLMGITAEVNLFDEQSKYFIEIIVPPYTVPISFRGRFYYRSGSVMQELTGTALYEFLLKRSGRTWDEEIEPDATFADIDEESFQRYLVMSKEKGRLPDVEGLTMEQVFDKLRLTKEGKLKRAAIVLFGKDPRRFYISSFVKIGRFASETDLRFQDVEEGNLIVMQRNVLEQINRKYLIRPVEFEGFYRIDKYEYPIAALREMILNALIHRNYMGAHTQIRIYDDKITAWNDGRLPEGVSLEMLHHTHSSSPRNPLIADVCFKGGLIDAWGRGTITILESCKEAELPEPELRERDGGFLVTLFKNKLTEEQLVKIGLNPRQIKAVQYVKEKGRITNKKYQEINDISKRTATSDLSELVQKYELLKNTGIGAGSYYEIIGQ